MLQHAVLIGSSIRGPQTRMTSNSIEKEGHLQTPELFGTCGMVIHNSSLSCTRSSSTRTNNISAPPSQTWVRVGSCQSCPRSFLCRCHESVQGGHSVESMSTFLLAEMLPPFPTYIKRVRAHCGTLSLSMLSYSWPRAHNFFCFYAKSYLSSFSRYKICELPTNYHKRTRYQSARFGT